MKHLQILLFMLILLATRSATAQTDDNSPTEAEKTARQLLDISGGGKLGIQVFQQLMSSFKQNLPNVPTSFWNEITKDVNPNDLVTLAVPIYVKHFTVDEMNNIMAFYKTPTGANVVP